MGVVICGDAEQAAMRLADELEEALLAQPDLQLGLATGSTPAKAYLELLRRYHQRQQLTFRYATTFNTDEFVGVAPQDPRSVRYFMNANLFAHADFSREHTYIPRGDVAKLKEECRAYDALIDARGGLDLVVLGLGHNGHIGFNEPGSSVKSKTRVVEFTESTIAGLSDGRRFKSLDETPVSAISVGLSTILQSKRILLIATGLGKRQVVQRMFSGRPGPSVPASQLLQHPGLTVLVDTYAGEGLRHTAAEIVEDVSDS